MRRRYENKITRAIASKLGGRAWCRRKHEEEEIHWCKAASDAVARTHDPFASAGTRPCLVENACDEILVTCPGKS